MHVGQNSCSFICFIYFSTCNLAKQYVSVAPYLFYNVQMYVFVYVYYISICHEKNKQSEYKIMMLAI